MSTGYINLPITPGGSGGIQSINGDTTSAQTIVGGTGISVSTIGGTTTITNTGTAADSFVIIQTPSGTYPTATSATDTLTYTNTDGYLDITGNAGTKTINITIDASLLALINGKGSVTSVSVVSANGFAGSVTNPTTTPAITISTSVVGILYGNGSSVATAVPSNFPTLNQNTTGTASNITATSNSTLTTLSALALPTSQLSGSISAAQMLGLLINQIYVGNGLNQPAAVAMSGDATIVSSGAITLSTVNTSPGTYTYATITVDAKGRATAVSSGVTPPSYTFTDSLENISGVVTLVNDSASPAANSYYGTNGTATLGYFSLPTSVISVTASAPLASSGGTTPNITISQATTSTNGYLSSTDWNTFNNKQPSGNYITALTGDATASGPGSAALTLATVNASPGTYTNATVTVNAKGLVTAASGGTSAVTSVTASSPLQSSGGSTPNISFTNQSANTALLGPLTGSASAPTFRAIAGIDIDAATALLYFGDGSDGNVTISSSVTLTRDMYYNNLTISTGAVLNTGGFRIFVAGTLDLTAAPANSITRTPNNGGNGSGASGGTNGLQVSAGSIAGSGAGSAGGTGGTGSGSNTGGVAAYTGNGGTSVNGGTGGAGSNGNGGTGSSGTLTTLPIRIWNMYFLRQITLLGGGIGGSGGGGGGGNGTNTGSGGGGGGGGGGLIFLSAATINRGSGTAASAISVKGGNGGTQPSPPAGASCGGGGGGSGGGGGWIYLAYGTLTGSTATNALDASGGAGGNGGNGNVTGGGNGGGSGAGGTIELLNIGAQTVSYNVGSAGTTGGAASGTTGGTGTSANTFQVSL